MDIILRNFFRLLRSGAFTENAPLEPMSSFKWRRLYQMVEAQNVVDVFLCGVAKHKKEDGLNIPNDLLPHTNSASSYRPCFRELISRNVTMSSGLLNKRLQTIFNDERHSIDTSLETMLLLKLIVINEQDFLNHSINMKDIILLGSYLREKGDRVDFVKLDYWLGRLFLQRMAQLQGSILVSVFGFELDELPFVRHEEPEAFKLVVKSVKKIAKDTAQEWHFRQTRSGFVRNNSTVLRRNMHRSVRFLPFASLETVSSFFTNFAKSLKEIEE